MTLKQFKNLLLTLTKNVFHYEAFGVTDNYIVWAEENETKATYADDKKIMQSLTGTVDLFSTDEYSPLVKQIQDLFNDNYISWRLNSIQYEKETGLTHWEWVWEVENWQV